MNTQPNAHEEKDVDVKSMFLVAVILFLSGGLIFFATWGLMRFLVARQNRQEIARPPTAQGSVLFPPPRLEAHPGLDLQNLRAVEGDRLNSYGWIDRSAGVARMPIDRAMQLILERGLPDVGANQTPLQFMQARPQEIPAPKPQP
jgi:hypothetical protein